MAKSRRVSEIYKLGLGQGSLDFVDVDIFTDTPLFISPRALQTLPSDWGDECVHLVQSFFGEVLQLIKSGRNEKAEALLAELKEPNETHLGLSVGKSQGRALGTESAKKVWAALSRSEAAKSGLLRDLEDTALLIEGVGVDIISDVTTNIIRGPLITYTQDMAEFYGIPLESNLAAGNIWNPVEKRWDSKVADLPLTKEGRLLLVPKSLVRADLQYKAADFYRHYVLTHLQDLEFQAGSALVRILKDGTRKPPSKKSMMEKYGTGKRAAVRETLKHPAIMDKYRAVKDREPYKPLSSEHIADVAKIDPPEWDALLEDVLKTPTGKASATKYEQAIDALLTALFAPDLAFPSRQYPLHDRRKIVDLKFTNMGMSGFFHWLAVNYPAPHIWIECKNYSGEVANPELDQLIGRFSNARGRVGFLVCRSFDDKARFLRRCKDTVGDGNGYILPLDDGDLKKLVEARKGNIAYVQWPLLRDRFEKIIS